MLLVCLHIYLFRLCIKKDSERGVTFKIFYFTTVPLKWTNRSLN